MPSSPLRGAGSPFFLPFMSEVARLWVSVRPLIPLLCVLHFHDNDKIDALWVYYTILTLPEV